MWALKSGFTNAFSANTCARTASATATSPRPLAAASRAARNALSASTAPRTKDSGTCMSGKFAAVSISDASAARARRATCVARARATASASQTAKPDSLATEVKVRGLTSLLVSGVPKTVTDLSGAATPGSNTEKVSPPLRPGAFGGNPNDFRSEPAKTPINSFTVLCVRYVTAGAVTSRSRITVKEGTRPQPRGVFLVKARRSARLGGFSFLGNVSSFASLPLLLFSSSARLAFSSTSSSFSATPNLPPPSHVSGFHTTTDPHPGMSNAFVRLVAPFASTTKRGHRSRGGTYTTKCVGGTDVSSTDVSKFQSPSTKKGNCSSLSTNALFVSSHTDLEDAKVLSTCRNTCPSAMSVTLRFIASLALTTNACSTSTENRHPKLCPWKSGAAFASVNERVAAPSGRVE
mmetsp:Transcript_4111/g.15104  ORF Transcript_4111/g.15104 Transcript_4111/m.15104 type:complete len:406 (-) Transcript_4111:1078-2295(-)